MSVGLSRPSGPGFASERRATQRLRLRLDRVAFRPRETAPRLDRDVCVRTPPRPDKLPVQEDAARPDARCPERATTVGLGHQELAIGSLKEEVRVAAREEPWAGDGLGGGVKRRHVAGQDPRIADRRSHRRQ